MIHGTGKVAKHAFSLIQVLLTWAGCELRQLRKREREIRPCHLNEERRVPENASKTSLNS
eukprot:371301-Rhodomonas_salina.1